MTASFLPTAAEYGEFFLFYFKNTPEGVRAYRKSFWTNECLILFFAISFGNLARSLVLAVAVLAVLELCLLKLLRDEPLFLIAGWNPKTFEARRRKARGGDAF